MEPVKDIALGKDVSLSGIFRQMKFSGGFTGKDLGDAYEMLRDLIRGDYGRILTFTADIISTGTRGVIAQLIKEKAFDLVITTCGALDHDVARSFAEYYHGSFFEDDVKLRKKGIHRLGNVFIPIENYGPLIEKKVQDILSRKYPQGGRVPSYQISWDLGEVLNESSFLYWAYRNRIPVVVPGITDGAVGYQLWIYRQAHPDFVIDVLQDETLVSDFVYESKRLGALILGGGISKHHAIWWSQFREGLDVAIYITSAYEYDGSLSGALTREAISWGKVKPRGRHVTVHGDVTALLPFLVQAALYE